MNLRLDALLATLRDCADDIFGAIDADPLILKKEAAGLVLANAGKNLFTPAAPHHLFAKGIVYRRDPYRLVSLPLIKIYNLNEREFITLQTFSDLIRSAPTDRECRLHFLRKYDGSLIQRFQEFGRVWFTTRGGIDRSGDLGFDFIGTARRIAEEKYPVLLADHPDFEGLTLVFELLHPEARIITDYGDRKDLLLLTVMDRREYRYRTYDEVREFANTHGLTPVDAFAPAGATLPEQIDSLLASIAGTDQEGAVLTLEFGHEVVFRVKVKSPDYLRLLRLMVDCTYPATVAILDANTQIETWEHLEAFLRSRGTEAVPEELLSVYREHYTAHRRYLSEAERLLRWAHAVYESIRAEQLDASDLRAQRKWFAARVQMLPHNALLFAAWDRKLDLGRIRQFAATPEEMRAALALAGVLPEEP